MPRLLNYIIALYLIIVGVLGLLHGPRGTIGTSTADVPPAAVQHATPVRAGPVVGISRNIEFDIMHGSRHGERGEQAFADYDNLPLRDFA